MRLVLILPGNIYKVFEGRVCVAVFQATDKLLRCDIEALRTSKL